MNNDLVLATAGGLAMAARDDPELMTAVIAAMFKESLEEHLVVPDTRFYLDDISDAEALLKMRFTCEEIKRLVVGFCLPDVIITPQNVRVGSLEALCIVLQRFCFPKRLKELTLEFRRHRTLLSSIINPTVGLLYERFKSKLEFDTRMLQQCGRASADAILAESKCLENYIGFIDGMVRPVCLPTSFQRQCYNGHKRMHSLKFQVVIMANVLLASVFGPIEGRRHDVALLRELSQCMYEDCNGYYLYGDPAYPLVPWLIGPVKQRVLSNAEAAFNRTMSKVRVSVEWSFGQVVRDWAFLDFKKL